MTDQRWRARLLLAVLLAVLLVVVPAGTPSVFGQEPAQQPSEASERRPVAVPAVEIPSRIEQSRNLIRRIDALPQFEQVRAIEAALGEATATLEERARQLRERLADEPTSRALEDVQRDWRRERSRLQAWQATIDTRWRQVEDLRQQLIDDRQAWDATIEEIRGEEPGSELLTGLRGVLADVAAAQDRLDQRLASLLTVQTRVGNAIDVVSENLGHIQEQMDSARLRLFERGAAPIWSAVLDNDEPLLRALAHSYRDAGSAISGYVRRSLQPIAQHLLLLLALALLLRAARTTRDALAAGERPEGAPALDRPVSAAYLTLLLLMATLYPTAPSAWYELLLLIAVVPLMRTAFRVLPKTVHKAVRWTIALFAVYLLLTPSSGEGLLTRLVLIAFTPIAITVFASVAYRLDDPGSGPWRRTVRLGMQAGVMLLSLSLVGAILGWSSLSWLLADATARSAYLAMLLATVGRILVALAELLPDTRVGGFVRHLTSHREQATRTLRRLAHAVIWFVWVYVTLVSFGLADVIVDALDSALDSSLSVGTITISLRIVIGVVAILVAAGLLSRYLRFLLSEEVFARRATAPGESNAILTIVHYLVMAFGVLMAGSAAGLTGTQLTVVAGALGVGIGFGLQAIVNNFVSGLILVFERPVSVGDRVEVGSYTGIIERIGIRASVLRTYSGAEIVIPNADLITKEVTNWTLSDARRRVDVPVGVAYGSDTTKVLEIMEQVARQEPLVIESPEPMVFFRGFGDSSLNFELFCWCNAPDIFLVASKVALEINARFAEAGITIPFPQRDLHLRSIEPGLALDTRERNDAVERGGDDRAAAERSDDGPDADTPPESD